MGKKYELIEEEILTIDGHTLHRIKALRDFGKVHAGDVGGWIESEKNLSQEKRAWVYEDARVYGGASVSDNAMIAGNAEIASNASIYGCAIVRGDAFVSGNVKIFDHADVSGKVFIRGRNLAIYGHAKLFNDANISGSARIYGNARVSGCANVMDEAEIFEDASVSGDARIYGNANISGFTRVFGNTQVGYSAQIGDNATIYGTAYIGDCLPSSGNHKAIVGGDADIASGHIEHGMIVMSSQDYIVIGPFDERFYTFSKGDDNLIYVAENLHDGRYNLADAVDPYNWGMWRHGKDWDRFKLACEFAQALLAQTQKEVNNE